MPVKNIASSAHLARGDGVIQAQIQFTKKARGGRTLASCPGGKCFERNRVIARSARMIGESDLGARPIRRGRFTGTDADGDRVAEQANSLQSQSDTRESGRISPCEGRVPLAIHATAHFLRATAAPLFQFVHRGDAALVMMTA